MEIANFKDGMLDGKQISFYEDGKILQETDYRNDIRNGLTIHYSRDGSKVIHEIKNDTLHGFVRYFNADGILTHELQYSNDTTVGIEKFFYDNGKLEMERPYDNEGYLQGTGYGYNEGGEKIFEIDYVKGKKTARRNYSKGKLIETIIYDPPVWGQIEGEKY